MSVSMARDEAAARLAAGVASYGLDVPIGEIIEGGPGRGYSAVPFHRPVAMYLCHTAFELSLARVAIAFGRDRSTVAYACHQIEDRRDHPAFDGWIAALEAMLRDAPEPGHGPRT